MRSKNASSAARTRSIVSSTERRSRTRLRDLCDEVLASFRAASSQEIISESDRAESHALLSRIAPLTRR